MSHRIVGGTTTRAGVFDLSTDRRYEWLGGVWKIPWIDLFAADMFSFVLSMSFYQTICRRV
jgi:hypothetical protein